MSWFDKNIDKIKIGLEGEEMIREYLMRQKIPFMQVDIMYKENDQWYCGEIKTQEIFKAPPFDGHGLPQWQINRRIQFYNDTGVIPMFFVYDLEEKCIYYNNLLYLNNKVHKNEVLRTKGAKPRTIYNIDLFKRIEI
tara:strand:- start:852 stop:1262 length:411 start_codon:yes stop_codon:yes gene_type:complete